MKRLLLNFGVIAGSLILVSCGDVSVSSRSPNPVPPEKNTSQPPVPATKPSQNPPPVIPKIIDPSISRTFFSVTFKEINEKGYPMMVVQNLTDKDIDMVSGSFIAENDSGIVVYSSAYTEGVPNSLFTKANASIDLSPFGLKRKHDLMKTLKESPDKLAFFFEARSIQYMDGSKEAKLQ